MKSRFLPVVLLLGCGLLGGCAAAVGLPPQATRQKLAELEYPDQAAYGPDLDVIVVRRAVSIELVNRTTSTYQHHQLWLNRQYVREVELVAIGTGNVMVLESFINQYQESFPLGGLLRPEKGFPVVLAELYDPQAQLRYRLVVQNPGK